jgi:Kef-type K+ transport system membrane component KefB
MNARGAMEMILASVALEYKLIDQRIFVALIVMALVTSMLSAPALQRLMNKSVTVEQ